MHLAPSSMLLSLPTELVQQIGGYLPVTDLGSLRLASKGADHKLLTKFAEKFRHRSVLMTEFCLNALVGISKSRFSKVLESVTIWTYEFNDLDQGSMRHVKDEKTYLRETADQWNLMSSGHDMTLLLEAFNNLSSLQRVSIMERAVSPSGQRLTLFHKDTPYPTYGMNGYFSDTFSGPLCAGTAYFKARCVTKILSALGKTAQRPNLLLIDLGGCLSTFAFSVPSYLESQINDVLSNLDKFDFTIGYCMSQLRLGLDLQFQEEAGLYDLGVFLGRLKRLRHLVVGASFDREDFISPVTRARTPNSGRQDEAFFRWFAGLTTSEHRSTSAPLSESLWLPPPVTFAALETLEIGKKGNPVSGQVQIAPSVLLAVVNKLKPTLRRLELCVVLTENTKVYSKTEGLVTTVKNLWRDLLSLLAQMITGGPLEFLGINQPCQIAVPSYTGHIIAELDTVKNATEKERVANYWKGYVFTGPFIADTILDLATNIRLNLGLNASWGPQGPRGPPYICPYICPFSTVRIALNMPVEQFQEGQSWRWA